MVWIVAHGHSLLDAAIVVTTCFTFRVVAGRRQSLMNLAGRGPNTAVNLVDQF